MSFTDLELQRGGNDRRSRQNLQPKKQWRRALAPNQFQWTVETVQAFGWQSKSQAQQTLQLDMARSFQTMEQTAFPQGQADQQERIDPKGGRHWQRYISDLKGFEREQPPRKDPLLGMLRASAQAYIDHYNTEYSKREKESRTNLAKRASCLKTLADLRKYDVRDEFAKFGDPPWDSETAMKAASLKAGLDLESVPNGQMETLGGDGANPAFWVNRSGGKDGKTKTSLFKPEVSDVSDIAGMPPGCETAREALAGRTSDLLTGMTGIDFKMPETHVISIGKDKFPEGTLDRTPFGQGDGPVRGSVQQFAPTEGELRDQSASVMRKISSESCQNLAILDTVSLNMDRHSGNLLVNGAGTDTPEIVPIDHGLTFPTKDALRELPDQFGNDKNVLLKLANAYEPFSQEMLKKISQIEPDLLAGALRKEVTAIEQAHPETAGKVTEESVKISRRSAMFLKQAAGQLPPAILQVALGQNAESLLDPDIDDQEFARRANQVIVDTGSQAAEIKEYFLMMSDEERAAMRTALVDNGWPQDNLQLNQRWMMQNLKLALDLYKNDTKNPTMLQETLRTIGKDEMDRRISQGMPFVTVYGQVVLPAMSKSARPIDLDESTPGEARDMLREFPKMKVNPDARTEKDLGDLRAALGQWHEFLKLGGTKALNAAITLLRLPPTHIAVKRLSLLDALGALRQAAALGAAPQLPPDPDDQRAKEKSLDYIEKILQVLPQQAQAPFDQRLRQLRLAVQTDGALLRRITDVKERHKDEIAALKADVFDAARRTLSDLADDLVRQLRGPLNVSADMWESSLAGTRAQIRAGNVLDAKRQIDGLKRAFGAT